ncbi:MAG: tetratricopeptide repeat protein [Acidobacteriaceae bacterium]
MNSTLIGHNVKKRQPLNAAERMQRRKLMVQDGLALLSLAAITVCIAVMTYFFFHSFREHRGIMERRWYARGERAMAAGHPQDAVQDFRSALSLSTANANYEMSLAVALAASGRTDEAYAYFSTLHDAEPGDGFLNLQLARLEARRNNSAAAIDFYQSALNGAWRGEGAERRLQIRLDLARYLLSLGRVNDAQGELLTAEGNSLDNPVSLFEIAGLLQQAGAPSDAWTAYQRVERHASAHPPLILQSLLEESRIATSMGQYKRAALALDRYTARERQHPKASAPEQRREVAARLAKLQRMLQLVPFYGLQPKHRAERVLLAADIAHRRFAGCVAQIQPQTQSPNVQPATQPATLAPAVSPVDTDQLALLNSQWLHLGNLHAANLAGNADLEQGLMAWVNQAEILTAKLCGTPTGDNALLLQLARVPDKTE